MGALLTGGLIAAASSPEAPVEGVDAVIEECAVNAVIMEDITWSYSNQNFADTIDQLQAAVRSFVGASPAATLGVSSFGQISPIPTAETLGDIDVQSPAGAERLSTHVGSWDFHDPTSSDTNWEAGLLNARDVADAQGAKTILFVTDGVPNSYFIDGVPTEGGGMYDPVAVTHARRVADTLRADGYMLIPVFVPTDRPGLHGLNDPIQPTPQAMIVSAMQALQPGWTIDQAVDIAELAGQLRAQALASCSPSIDVNKTHQAPVDVNGNGLTDAGDRVTFVFDVTNTGDLPLTNVAVSDPILADLGVALVNDGRVGDLASGGTAQVTSDPYTITDQDVVNGGFHNLATVHGDSLSGPVSDEDDDTVPTGYVNGITIEKTHTERDITDVTGNGRIDAGDTVVFTFSGQNTGSTVLTDVVVTDDLLAEAGVGLADNGVVGTLTVGETYSLKSEAYALTQADVDAGEFRNVASITGTPPVGEHPTDQDEDVVALDRDVAIHLEKSHSDADLTDTNGNGRVDAGDQVMFSFEVTNTGTVTLSHVMVSDPTLANVGIGLEDSGQIGVLAPGEVRVLRSEAYTLTKADVDRGYFHNIATAAGIAPTGEAPNDDDDDKVVTTAPTQQSGLASTGVDPTWLIGGGAFAVLLIAGGLALFRRKRA